MADLYRTQILLERRQHQDLSDLAKAEGRSMSEMVREAVAEYLVERREESRRLDWNERLAELAKIREAIRAESGEFLEEFILNDRAEREEELAQKVWGGECPSWWIPTWWQPWHCLYRMMPWQSKHSTCGVGRVNGLLRLYFSNTN